MYTALKPLPTICRHQDRSSINGYYAFSLPPSRPSLPDFMTNEERVGRGKRTQQMAPTPGDEGRGPSDSI